MENLLNGINRIAFSIGSIDVAWYGLIIVIGMLVGLALIYVECKRINLTHDDAIELFLWIIPLAIIFARILYVIVRPDEYFPWNSWDDFVAAIAIWDGGITIIGGIFGGIIGAGIFAYRKRGKCNFGQIVDLVIVPLLLGQIIGRLGNFVNQEAFGVAITNPDLQMFPFAVFIDNPSGITVPDGWYAATFFYEMVWNIIGASIFFAVWRKNKKYPGILGIGYFVWYFLGRGWLEFIRLDAVPITKVACFIVAPIAILVGIAYMLTVSSRLSFKKVNEAYASGNLANTELTKFDIKNYKFAAKWLAKSGVIAWKFYKLDSINIVDLDNAEYVPYQKKPKEKKAAKSADSQSE